MVGGFIRYGMNRRPVAMKLSHGEFSLACLYFPLKMCGELP
jgi:hypothetical protein